MHRLARAFIAHRFDLLFALICPASLAAKGARPSAFLGALLFAGLIAASQPTIAQVLLVQGTVTDVVTGGADCGSLCLDPGVGHDH
jgi:hypothetical protein